MSEERFSRPVVEALAKRAGNLCSNPECGALTIGPAEEVTRTVVLGEAAHIYGARPTSARFDPAMTDAARGEITNGIWLCRNCHKLVDDEPHIYPAELLFEWRRDHEGTVRAQLGKAGMLRQKVLERRLEGFESRSYLVQQIVIDMPEYWQLKLTAELLRSSLVPIKRRWRALQDELYARPLRVVQRAECADWLNVTIEEIRAQVRALDALINGRVQAAWGSDDQPGSPEEIRQMCDLIVEACQQILDWEERVRFAALPDALDEVQALFQGVAGGIIDKVFEIPVWLAGIFDRPDPSGTYELWLKIDLPDRWPDRVQTALARASMRLRLYR